MDAIRLHHPLDPADPFEEKRHQGGLFLRRNRAVDLEKASM